MLSDNRRGPTRGEEGGTAHLVMGFLGGGGGGAAVGLDDRKHKARRRETTSIGQREG